MYSDAKFGTTCPYTMFPFFSNKVERKKDRQRGREKRIAERKEGKELE